MVEKLPMPFEAMDEVGLTDPFRQNFYSRLVLTAQHMINSPDSANLKAEKT